VLCVCVQHFFQIIINNKIINKFISFPPRSIIKHREEKGRRGEEKKGRRGEEKKGRTGGCTTISFFFSYFIIIRM
jgi:hypothetical protein